MQKGIDGEWRESGKNVRREEENKKDKNLLWKYQPYYWHDFWNLCALIIKMVSPGSCSLPLKNKNVQMKSGLKQKVLHTHEGKATKENI